MIGRDWFGILTLTALVLLYFYLLSTPVNLATADLGRHIRNGEQILSGNFSPLYLNFYSYTYPEFPFVNHHWSGGVVFYLVGMFTGLAGIQLLFISINFATFVIFFALAKKYSNIIISSITALLIIPVIAYRDEVRPEAFSYLFAGIYYLVLKGFSEGKISKKWLFSLIPIQLIWANTHIYFFVGFFIFGVFWFNCLLKWLVSRSRVDLNRDKNITIVGLLSLIISLLNPHFIRGLTYPFTIFGNYGYRVLENQSVLFLERILPIPVLLYFKIVLGLLILSWIYKLFRAIRYKEKVSWVDLVFSIFFSILALVQIRNLALFGFFSLVPVSQNLAGMKLEYPKYLLVPVLGILLIFLLVINPNYWESRPLGLGLAPGIERGAEFFAGENLKGPIFNNYDIGGYLIYYLYPKEKVFVDNRPEGYPHEFFTKTYVPMQEDDSVWSAKDLEYEFNSIFFYRQDLTPWAQKFLISRIKDPNWAPVFVDNYNIIFLKRNEQNSELIKKYELPKDIFKTE